MPYLDKIQTQIQTIRFIYLTDLLEGLNVLEEFCIKYPGDDYITIRPSELADELDEVDVTEEEEKEVRKRLSNLPLDVMVDLNG